jgi:hypothetical protein
MTIELFMQKVNKTKTCWLWTGQISNQGYGIMSIPPKRRVRVHRFAYEKMVGPIGKPDHTCHVRHCVNPAHLVPVTLSEHKKIEAAERTHCLNGHRLTKRNIMFWNSSRGPGGIVRNCRACYRLRVQKRNEKRAVLRALTGWAQG